MIRTIVKRSFVDIWDNAIVLFVLNIALLSAMAVTLYGVSFAVWLPPSAFVIVVLCMIFAGITLFSMVACLVDQIAQRAEVNMERCVPDIPFCALITPAFAGSLAVAFLLVSAEPVDPALRTAAVISGLWVGCLALQIIVLAPALALDRNAPATAKLAILCLLVFRFPLATITLIPISAASLMATVGLLPGPAGIAYLFLRAGRLMQKGLDQSEGAPGAGEGSLIAALAEEARPLKTRTLRNLIQPWRASR